jgi:hypothetical protein
MKYKVCKSFTLFALFICIMNLASCKKQMNPSVQRIVDAIPAAVNNTTVNTTGICDYVFNEAAVTAAGYSKVFEDNFDGGLSKWNIWTGGAFNNELQYYQAANLQLLNGNLIITAKKETVTGATTPFDATSKTFNYTSGRIECKTNISASVSTPKVRIVARIKLPSGYGCGLLIGAMAIRGPRREK